MNPKEGKYTAETFAEKMHLKRQSALNLLSRLKEKGLVATSGGGRQKRIYTVHAVPQVHSNGFYDVVNKYSPEKLVPKFKHCVVGAYTVEHAIIDGIRIGDARTKEATKYLFNHVTDCKRLFDLSKKNKMLNGVKELYADAHSTVKVRAMPWRYRP